MTSRIFQSTAPAGLGLLAACLLGGCAGYPSWGGGSKRHIPAQAATTLERPASADAGQNYYTAGERPMTPGNQ